MKSVFVVLHYLAEDVTCKCLDSLLSLNGGEEVTIVVVDNCSPDGSGDRLKGKYSDVKRVHFVMLNANEGFARGNNAGYRYAVEHFNPDFVVVMNNDVIVDDADFIRKVESEYKAEPFAVLGPDIITIDNLHQNPLRMSPMTLGQIRILRLKMSLKYLFYPVVKLFGLTGGRSMSEGGWCDASVEGCVLHGACYIFSRDFITARCYAFNPSTFLYCEEDILQTECAVRDLVCRYAPSLKVLHLEDCSSKAAVHSSWRRARLKYRRLIDSLSVLLTVRKSTK